jgi:hypothetical protein
MEEMNDMFCDAGRKSLLVFFDTLEGRIQT